MTTALAPASLTAADRCDRCSAQAYVRVRLVSGGELLFCSHHGKEHRPALEKIAEEIKDESHRLEATPSAAPDEER